MAVRTIDYGVTIRAYREYPQGTLRGTYGEPVYAVREVTPAIRHTTGQQIIAAAPYVGSDLRDALGRTPIGVSFYPGSDQRTADGREILPFVKYDGNTGAILVSNLLTNGDFATSVAGWTSDRGVMTHVTTGGGRMRLANSGGSIYPRAYQLYGSFVASKTYRLQVDLAAASNSGYTGLAGIGYHWTDLHLKSVAFGIGSLDTTFVADRTPLYVLIQGQSEADGDWFEFDNVKITEV